jgi:SAM-dependent methyltransferase
MPGTRKKINDRRGHWDAVYAANDPARVSWFQSTPNASLELISQSGITPDEEIIDVGGGASTLADHLMQSGHSRLTVLDVSPHALDFAKTRLGTRAALIRWITGDILSAPLDRHRYGLWHDRAVFHFLLNPSDRRRYGEQLRHALRPGGHAIIATFAEDGPLRCSGLDVRRYSVSNLVTEIGEGFELMDQRFEDHRTPSRAVQKFIYCLFFRTNAS